tara:strand:- start:283 stop:636 length:354 start_codon:yes stop_codon:yes gene_type:complete
MDDKRYESSALGAFIGVVGIIGICLVMVIMNSFTSCRMNVEPEKPQTQIPTKFYLELDTISSNLDDLDKRLESLLKLESMIDSMIEAIDTVWVDCTHSIYPDEHVMWIGGDGDTIWE